VCFGYRKGIKMESTKIKFEKKRQSLVLFVCEPNCANCEIILIFSLTGKNIVGIMLCTFCLQTVIENRIKHTFAGWSGAFCSGRWANTHRAHTIDINHIIRWVARSRHPMAIHSPPPRRLRWRNGIGGLIHGRWAMLFHANLASS